MTVPVRKVMHFSVHPSVLFKLGEDLITDDAQALAELIKNSYDADARTVRVQINTTDWFDRRTGRSGAESPMAYPPSLTAVRGKISVSDDGTGMSTSAIEKGWLTVSYSAKRALKREGGTTRLSRTPLGDKGLGRLGAQRLGAVLELRTTPAELTEDRAQFWGTATSELFIDWDRFLAADQLERVELAVMTASGGRRPAGSVVSVLGLTDPTYWTKRGQVSLQRELTSILSPYETANGVHVFVEVDGDQIDLRRQARAVLDSAPFRLRFRYSEGVLEVETDTSVTVLSGRNAADRRAFGKLIDGDRGASFAEWLLADRSRKATEVGAFLGDDRYFLKTRQRIQLRDTAPTGVAVADPGRFEGEISALNFDDPDESVFGSRSELASFAKSLQGIRVFRDGFGIRLAEDWLGLSKQQTSASSFYGLRPGNTTGYVNLTAKDNAALEETSSREAFRDTAAWRGFFALMTAVTGHARRSQEFVRRNWSVYKDRFEVGPELEELGSPKEISEHIQRQISTAEAANARLRQVGRSEPLLRTSIDTLSRAIAANDSSVWKDDQVSEALKSIRPQLETLQAQLRDAVGAMDEITAMQEQLRQASKLLSSKIVVAEERIAMAWESVALGLSAEVLAHEVESISDRLRGRSVLLLNHERNKSEADPRVIGFTEHVRSSASELTRQVSRLNPALRFRRERKSRRWVSDLLRDAAEYFTPKWEGDGVRFRIEILEDFEVQVNPGKFSQIIDNLALNSYYWIAREQSASPGREHEVAVVVSAPVIQVSDTGPGISETVDDSLFEAFVTAKPAGEGRGLGLFVVSQLLDSEGGSVRLSPHRNAEGRRDTFEIDLSSMMTGARRGGDHG